VERLHDQTPFGGLPARILARPCRFREGPFVSDATITHKEDAMKYLVLIYQGTTPTPADPEAWGRLSEDEQKAVYAAYGEINSNPNITPGVGMQPPETATTVRVSDGRTLTTDGPFAELKEAIGGYFVLEADDLDAAIEVAAKVPAASMGGAIEIRPVQEY
jgi:hypothetical protein